MKQSEIESMHYRGVPVRWPWCGSLALAVNLATLRVAFVVRRARLMGLGRYFTVLANGIGKKHSTGLSGKALKI